MTYVRWEYHETVTIIVDSQGQVAPPQVRIRPVEPAPAPRITSEDAARLLWLAPMAVAAGAAIAREAGHHDVLPRLGVAVRRLVAQRRRPQLLAGAEPRKLPAGDE